MLEIYITFAEAIKMTKMAIFTTENWRKKIAIAIYLVSFISVALFILFIVKYIFCLMSQ